MITRGIGRSDLAYIFPNAPRQPVTLWNNYVTPSWFDLIGGTSLDAREDEAGILNMSGKITKIIETTMTDYSIPAEKIVLVGFRHGMPKFL